MDLNGIRLFVQVVESGTFREAARVLGVPKSTVSLRVSQLEDRLGERLLERTTRQLRLSDAGAAYYRSAQAALEILREAGRAVNDRKAAPSGRLCVTTTIEGGQFTFAHIFAEYVRRYPDVRLEVLLADRQVDLIDEGIDVAIRWGSLPDSGFVAHRLRIAGSLRCYASPSYLRKHGTPRVPRELSRHACLVMTGKAAPLVWPFHDGSRSLSIQVVPRATANSFVVIGEFAKAGLGIARMPSSLAQPAVASGTLREVLGPFVPNDGGPLHAIYPSARHLSTKVRALLALLDEHATT